MAKTKTQFVCSECGADFPKWQGQCGACKAWDSLSEFKEAKVSKSRTVNFEGFAGQLSEVQSLNTVDLSAQPRFTTDSGEFDRVLGGGLVPGSAVLIGGNPGAGKSTILLQTMCKLSQQMPALYVTGEESMQQVAMRANRLGLPTDKLQMLSETNVESICEIAKQLQPKIIVIDSIQVMFQPEIESAPGSVSQVRESASYLTRYAKQTGTVMLFVGHVTKDGSLAGPKVLEHMIDCSVMLDSSGDSRFRTMRATKNRFGAVNELGVFAMLDSGLREVTNPSSIFLSRSGGAQSGSVVSVIWEGTRPMLIEIQALVDESHAGNPRRVAVGADQNRLNMLLAVLNKHGGIFTGDQDVFVNVVGGMRVQETGIDLAILMSIISSLRNKVISEDLLAFGEIGLSGEIRPVPNGQERIREAAKLGFKRALVPEGNTPKKKIAGIEVIAVTTLQQALQYID
jgi:DNA repair protein RadA/Sms